MAPLIIDGAAAADASAATLAVRPGTAVVRFSVEPSSGAGAVARVHASAIEGLMATRELLASPAAADLRSIVFTADAREDEAANLLASFVSCFGKTIARELARSNVTVNMVGGRLDDPGTAALLSFLLSDDARFITGQSFGAAGQRLASPGITPPSPAPGGWVLVSGGAGEIGGAVTRRLHADGWRIVIGHRGRSDAEALALSLSSDGSTCRTLVLDIEDDKAIASAAGALPIDGTLAGLVLCSGWNLTHPFSTTDAAEWHRTLRTNFTGPALLTEALFAGDRASPGFVIAIGSEAGRAGDSGRAVYAGAKAAVTRYTSLVAQRSAPLRAATVAPGPVDTPLLRGTHGDDPAAAEKGMERLARLIPLGRLGRPEEIAAAVSFVAGPAGTACHGEVVSVGGGITMQ